MDPTSSTDPKAVAAIRFADAICEHYFEVIRRLEKAARRQAFGGYEIEEPDLGLLCGEAEQTLSALRDSLATARRLAADARPAVATAILAPTSSADPEIDLRKLSDEVQGRIGLAQALEARSALRGLKSDWPGVDWSAGHAEAEVDLFAAKKRTALIVGGVALVAIAVLAFLYPYAALGVAGLLVIGWIWWIAIVRPRMKRLGM